MNKLIAFGLLCLATAYVLAEDNSVESVSGEDAATTIRPRRHSGFGGENGGRFGNGRFGQGSGFGEGRLGSGNSFGRGQLGGGIDRGFGNRGNDRNGQFGGRGFGDNNFGGSQPGRFGSGGFGGQERNGQFGNNQGWIPAGGKRGGFGERL